MNRYVLEATDPSTASIVHEVSFEISETAELCSLLDLSTTDLGPSLSHPLEASSVLKLKNHYGLIFDDIGFEVWLRPHHPNDGLPYKVHTGRELAMMLAGAKPLAAFTDDYPNPFGESSIPEKEFEPHVGAGRFVKRESNEPPSPNAPVIDGQPIGLRRVLYALPGEEWRIDAYLKLWETAKITGWTEQLEREEGTLLGYEDWQNEIHIARQRVARPLEPAAGI
jgi:hypothetical protein